MIASQLAKMIDLSLASAVAEDLDFSDEFANCPVPLATSDKKPIDRWLNSDGDILTVSDGAPKVYSRPVDGEERTQRRLQFWKLHRRDFGHHLDTVMLYIENLRGLANSQLSWSLFVNAECPYQIAVLRSYIAFIDQQIQLLEADQYDTYQKERSLNFLTGDWSDLDLRCTMEHLGSGLFVEA